MCQNRFSETVIEHLQRLRTITLVVDVLAIFLPIRLVLSCATTKRETVDDLPG